MIFQFVERQPTPNWDHQRQNPAVRNCIGCLWRGSKVLAVAGALGESSEVREFLSLSVPTLLLPAGNKQAQEYGPGSSRNVTICHAEPLEGSKNGLEIFSNRTLGTETAQ